MALQPTTAKTHGGYLCMADTLAWRFFETVDLRLRPKNG